MDRYVGEAHCRPRPRRESPAAAPTLLGAALRPLIVAADEWLRWPADVMDAFVDRRILPISSICGDAWPRSLVTLAFRFQRFRYDQRGMLSRLLLRRTADYADFAEFLSGSGWENFLREYAVLSPAGHCHRRLGDGNTATNFTRLIRICRTS
ncbi:MAG: hypothetical protein R2856_23425 [Caldilineaceae bacterium]